jgi:hypothetical protein
MLNEKGKGLSSFCALTVILNAITSLNLRELEPEAVAKRAWGVFNRCCKESSKGKLNVANLD